MMSPLLFRRTLHNCSSDVVDRIGDTGAMGTVSATINMADSLNAVANNSVVALLALWRKGSNCAFEWIKGVRLAVHR